MATHGIPGLLVSIYPISDFTYFNLPYGSLCPAETSNRPTLGRSDPGNTMNTYPDLQLYINGKWRRTASDMPVLNPATEEEIGRLPVAETSDLDDALEAAEKGFRIWRQA